MRQNLLTYAIMVMVFSPLSVYAGSYPQWLQQFKAEAVQQGISPALLENAFQGSYPNETIIRLDRKQPETSITLNQYLQNTVTQSRVTQGRHKYQQYRELLEEIGHRYGVQPRFIVALWGIETSFGQVTGGFNIIHALATLAYDGRRAEFFRNELMNALRILQQGHIDIGQFQGSWAGAMGQCQFMPSTFLNYAQDYNGDGRINIWTDMADVFASMANYLSQIGWRDDLTWGREVRLPEGFDLTQADIAVKKSLPEWSLLGVRKLDGTALPQENEIIGSVVIPSPQSGRAFLVYENFDHLLEWNRSKYFATAVGTLADRIGN
jgi:membrane-bound lytic murein transglycosylase B